MLVPPIAYNPSATMLTCANMLAHKRMNMLSDINLYRNLRAKF